MSRKKPAPAKTATKTARPATKAADAAKPADAAEPAEAGAAPAGPRPVRLTVAAVLAGVEGLVLVGFGVYVLIMGLAGNPESPEQAETLGITVLALALLPLLAARGLWLRRRWSRGPAMITQLMALPVAWTLVQNGGGLIAIGVLTAVAAVTVLGLLINPTATEALGIGPRDA
ncbi:hypothetical protein ACFZCY_09290 [Streptomyces sp. NPDC007983]|uniref:hypothetical protein n=1 Tax=Streptomyces sp. NPDC007983 TaxID=3364800 RepID=UPI0036E963D5